MDQTQSWWTGGLGLRLHVPGGRSFLHLEALYNALLRVGKPDHSVSLTRVRGYVGYNIARHVALIAGGTLNYATSYDGSTVEIPAILHEYEFPLSTDARRFWPGAFLGIQF